MCKTRYALHCLGPCVTTSSWNVSQATKTQCYRPTNSQDPTCAATETSPGWSFGSATSSPHTPGHSHPASCNDHRTCVWTLTWPYAPSLQEGINLLPHHCLRSRALVVRCNGYGFDVWLQPYMVHIIYTMIWWRLLLQFGRTNVSKLVQHISKSLTLCCRQLQQMLASPIGQPLSCSMQIQQIFNR